MPTPQAARLAPLTLSAKAVVGKADPLLKWWARAVLLCMLATTAVVLLEV